MQTYTKRSNKANFMKPLCPMQDPELNVQYPTSNAAVPQAACVGPCHENTKHPIQHCVCGGDEEREAIRLHSTQGAIPTPLPLSPAPQMGCLTWNVRPHVCCDPNLSILQTIANASFPGQHFLDDMSTCIPQSLTDSSCSTTRHGWHARLYYSVNLLEAAVCNYCSR